MSKKLNLGFSLVEMLLSVAALGGILAIGIPFYNSAIGGSDLEKAKSVLISNLVYARTAAGAVDGDAAWGVHVGGGNIVLYKGNTYATRDVSLDQLTQVNNSIIFSGDSEITFKRFEATPNASANFSLTNSNNQTTNVSVSDAGVIDF